MHGPPGNAGPWLVIRGWLGGQVCFSAAGGLAGRVASARRSWRAGTRQRPESGPAAPSREERRKRLSVGGTIVMIQAMVWSRFTKGLSMTRLLFLGSFLLAALVPCRCRGRRRPEAHAAGGVASLQRPDRLLERLRRAVRHARGEAKGLLAGNHRLAMAVQGRRRLADRHHRQGQVLHRGRAALPARRRPLSAHPSHLRQGRLGLQGDAGRPTG